MTYMASGSKYMSERVYRELIAAQLRPLLMKGVQMVVNDNCFGVIVPASGRLLNLGCIAGHHSFLVSCSFTKHVLAQLDLLRH